MKVKYNWSIVTEAEADAIKIIEIKTLEDLISLKLGPRNPKEICETCNSKVCYPHYGKISLPFRIIFKHFHKPLKDFLIYKLCITCKNTGKCKKCHGFNHVEFLWDGTCKVNHNLIYTPDELYEFINENYKVKDSKDPKNMIQNFLLVLPNSQRPLMRNTDGKEILDQWTISYQKIFENVLKYKKNENNNNERQCYRKNCIDLINKLVDNNVSVEKGINVKNKPGILRKFQGRYGQLREVNLGKPTINCGRAVIVGEPFLNLNEIGIPKSICESLSYPLKIFSLESLEICKRKYIVSKRYHRIENPNGEIFKKCPNNIGIGWTVYRFIENGDYCLLNRQPTLHSGSMMVYRVKVIHQYEGQNVIYLPLSCTKPYNADFDGDEMNIHFPLDIESISEYEELFYFYHHVIDFDGRNQIGLIQNSVLSLYRLSLDYLTKEKAMHLLNSCEVLFDLPLVPDLFVNRVCYYRGLTIINTILKNIQFKDRNYHNNEFIIYQGQIILGGITGSYFGSRGQLVSELWYRYDQQTFISIMSKLQILSETYSYGNGVSLGLDDIQFKSQNDTISETLNKNIEEYFNKDTIEFKNSLEEIRVKIVNKLIENKKNSFYLMCCSESKGNLRDMSNINTMCEFLGQQVIDGKPIPNFLGSRILATLNPNKDLLLSKGFIRNNLINGLNATELFLSSMAGRCGMIGRALETSEAGTLSRILMYRLGDIKINYFGCVVDGNHRIVQFEYGGDGLNPKYLKNLFSNNNNKICNSVKTRSEESLIYQSSLIHSGYEFQKQYVNFIRETWNRNQYELKDYLNLINQKIQQYKLEPGTPVGIIFSQLLGEPLTQLKLDKMHLQDKIKDISALDLIELIQKRNPPKRQFIYLKVPNIKEFLMNNYPYHMNLEKWWISNNQEDDEWIQLFDEEIHSLKHLEQILIVEFNTNYLLHEVLFHYLNLKLNNRKFRLSPYQMKNKYVVHLEMKPNEKDEDIIEKCFRLNKNYKLIEQTNKNKPCNVRIETDLKLRDIFRLFPNIDHSHTISNNHFDVHEALGIEKAREVLYDLIMEFPDIKLNFRHLSFLTDCMYYVGTFAPIKELGIKLTNPSSLAKAAIRAPIKKFVHAGTTYEIDETECLYSSIMMGVKIPMGSGYPDFNLETLTTTTTTTTNSTTYEDKINELKSLGYKEFIDYIPQSPSNNYYYESLSDED